MTHATSSEKMIIRVLMKYAFLLRKILHRERWKWRTILFGSCLDPRIFQLTPNACFSIFRYIFGVGYEELNKGFLKKRDSDFLLRLFLISSYHFPNSSLFSFSCGKRPVLWLPSLISLNKRK